MYMHSALIFQCKSSHDVNLVIRLTKFGNIWCGYDLGINFQSDFNHDVLYMIWRLFCRIIQYLHHSDPFFDGIQ
jgi:hypothetical protein